MRFRSYGDIENTYNNKLIAQVRDMGFDNPEIKYACFTKIDGSNLQCSIDENQEFKVGTRSNILGRESTFQGYDRAMRNENVEESLREMKKYIIEAWDDKNYFDLSKEDIKTGKFILTVYGELCGGFYRHAKVEKVKGATKIQGRIDYHPDNMWVPFDILIRNEEVGKSYLCTTVEVWQLCNMVQLPSQIEKFVGTFDECLNYQNDFIDDTGNRLWGLPIIEGNITEGVVIKPIKPLWFNNGQRVIFKNKNEKFKERICKSPKEPKEVVPMNDLERKYFEFAREFITESRLMSVFSKVGEVNEKSFGIILGMFLKDLWKDFDKEYAEEIAKIEKETTVDEFNFSKARKEIAKETAEFIRPMFIQKLNN